MRTLPNESFLALPPYREMGIIDNRSFDFGAIEGSYA